MNTERKVFSGKLESALKENSSSRQQKESERERGQRWKEQGEEGCKSIAIISGRRTHAITWFVECWAKIFRSGLEIFI